MLKPAGTFLFLIMLTLLNCGLAQSPPGSGFINRLVIDAGHGGYDSGAKGSSSKEKDITLAIALKTKEIINKNLPEIEVILTRERDVFIPLHRRAEIANHSAADLFISIHCNSNPSPKPFGAETYVMGLHKSAENLEVAKTENMAILMEDNYEMNYSGFNPDLDEDYILLTMFQHNSLDKSILFSTLIQDNLKINAGLFNRGVKQAGFVVLYLTTMPGVLIETGFLSNPAEEQFLLNPKNQEKIAEAIFLAIHDFKKQVDETQKTVQKLDIRERANEKKAPAVFFKIAFLVSDSLIDFDNPLFDQLSDVWAFEFDGGYSYAFGEYQSYQLAEQELLTKMNDRKMKKKLGGATILKVQSFE